MRRLTTAALAGASYVAGAFPTAELVTKAMGRDVRHEGSGNPGATNTYRIAGAPAAAVVVTVDMAKGALATWAGGPACGVAAVVGHCFPPQNPAGGGKGVATTGGMLFALDRQLAVLAGVAWAAVAKSTRKASLASIATAAGLPVAAVALRRRRSEVVALVAVAVVIVIRHRDNLARLRRGEEKALESGDPKVG